MKKISLFLFILTNILYGQQPAITSKQLSENEIKTVFSEGIKNKYNISFDIYRAYAYDDAKGSHLILMTHHIIHKGNTAFKKNTSQYHDSIQAFFFHKKGNQIQLKHKITDFITENAYSDEYSISFWTKFFRQMIAIMMGLLILSLFTALMVAMEQTMGELK